MNLDKDVISKIISSNPEIRSLMNSGKYDEVFKLIRNRKERNMFAAVLFNLGINFLNKMTEIPEFMFSQNDLLTDIEIPGNIKRIGDFAFMGCENLSRVTFNEGLEEIGKGAFSGTKITAMQLPKTVKKLEDGSCGRANVFMFATREDLRNLDISPNTTTKDIINADTSELIG